MAKQVENDLVQEAGLREGDDMSNCGLCKNFDGNGSCLLLGTGVLPTQVCDFFENGQAAVGGNEQALMDALFGGMVQSS